MRFVKETLLKYFAHGLLFSITYSILIFVWLFLIVTIGAIGFFFGLIGLLILFMVVFGVNPFLINKIWKNHLKTDSKALTNRGPLLAILLLLVSSPLFIVRYYFPSLPVLILFSILYCFVDGFVAKSVGSVETIRLGRNVEPTLFLVPTFLLLVIFVFYPIFDTVYQSFLAGGTGRFVGLQNYYYVLFGKIYPLINLNNIAIGAFPLGGMIHNILWVIIQLPLVVLFGLGFAVLLRDVKGGAIIKAIVFLGVVIPMVVGGVLFRFMYDNDAGVVNAFLRFVGLGAYAKSFLIYPQTALISIILASVWIWTGFAMVIYSAGLEGIPAELYEAAKIDGASRWKTFWRITVPMLRSTTMVVITLTVLWELKIFDIVYVATSGGPGGASSVMAYDMYIQAFTFPSDYGSASAIAVLLTLMTFGLAAYMVSRMAKQ